jgi:basic membrane lipoprotein Med (substrate-binding protein (PBP1-ABC) superfamily)
MARRSDWVGSVARRLRRVRPWMWLTGGGVLVALVVVLVVALAGGGGPAPRARQYLAFDACLLTDAHGVTAGSAAAPVWRGMQAASLATRAKVSYLAVTGPATRDNATPFLNSLIARHCDLVLAAGQPQTDAVRAAVVSYPDRHFVAVGGSGGAPNLAVVPAGPADQVAARVRAVVADAVHGTFAGSTR